MIPVPDFGREKVVPETTTEGPPGVRVVPGPRTKEVMPFATLAVMA